MVMLIGQVFLLSSTSSGHAVALVCSRN